MYILRNCFITFTETEKYFLWPEKVLKQFLNSNTTEHMLHKMMAVLSIALFTTTLTTAQISLPASSPSATITQAVGLTKITVNYSRPSVKGRSIFGDLVPFGKVWRTGANKIPDITFDNAVMIGSQKVEAGKYGLATIPGEKEWVIILNKDHEQWGTYGYDATKDVLRVTVPAEKLGATQELFTIDFQNYTKTSVEVVIAWERSAARFKVSHDPHQQIMEAIQTATAKADCSTDDYFTAAEYYRDQNLDLKQALAWAEKVLEKDKNWWSYYLRASIHAKLGNCAQATADAKISQEGAKKDGDEAYQRMNQKILDGCKGK
jgi:Protein of unknown function (DUF2911)